MIVVRQIRRVLGSGDNKALRADVAEAVVDGDEGDEYESEAGSPLEQDQKDEAEVERGGDDAVQVPARGRGARGETYGDDEDGEDVREGEEAVCVLDDEAAERRRGEEEEEHAGQVGEEDEEAQGPQRVLAERERRGRRGWGRGRGRREGVVRRGDGHGRDTARRGGAEEERYVVWAAGQAVGRGGGPGRGWVGGAVAARGRGCCRPAVVGKVKRGDTRRESRAEQRRREKVGGGKGGEWEQKEWRAKKLARERRPAQPSESLFHSHQQQCDTGL